MGPTADGQNPAPPGGWLSQVYPAIHKGFSCFIHPNWCRMSSIHCMTVCLALGIRALTGGFVVGGSSGYIAMWELAEEEEPFWGGWPFFGGSALFSGSRTTKRRTTNTNQSFPPCWLAEPSPPNWGESWAHFFKWDLNL